MIEREGGIRRKRFLGHLTVRYIKRNLYFANREDTLYSGNNMLSMTIKEDFASEEERNKEKS